MRKKTPLPFISACDKFIYIEILKVADQQEKEPDKKSKVKENKNPLSKINADLIKLLTESVTDLADESGWTFLGELGNFILRKKPDFDPRNYGFTKLYQLIKSTDKFIIDERETSNKNIRHIYIKRK